MRNGGHVNSDRLETLLSEEVQRSPKDRVSGSFGIPRWSGGGHKPSIAELI